MRAINVAANAITDCAPDQHVRKKMVAPGKTRRAYQSSKPVSRNLTVQQADGAAQESQGAYSLATVNSDAAQKETNAGQHTCQRKLAVETVNFNDL